MGKIISEPGPSEFGEEGTLLARRDEAYARARREVFDEAFTKPQLTVHQARILVELESAELALKRYRERRRAEIPPQ